MIGRAMGVSAALGAHKRQRCEPPRDGPALETEGAKLEGDTRTD